MSSLREILKRINTGGSVLFNESMKNHTSFNIGGPADVFITPDCVESLKTAILFLKNNQIPFFLLGGGSNILVADSGIRGAVIDLSAFSTIEAAGTIVHADAGASISAVSEEAARNGLSGLEFLYAMPGTAGGALLMNARCYGREIGDVASSALILDKEGILAMLPLSPCDFSYKKSPFQGSGSIILKVIFTLGKGDPDAIWAKMNANKSDRGQKGHFNQPSAGCIFKNSRAFGKTTGEIIDSLSLKGFQIGDAAVSTLHANFIENRGNAKAADVLAVIAYIEKEVREKFGFELEREIILVGEWVETRNSQ